MHHQTELESGFDRLQCYLLWMCAFGAPVFAANRNLPCAVEFEGPVRALRSAEADPDCGALEALASLRASDIGLAVDSRLWSCSRRGRGMATKGNCLLLLGRKMQLFAWYIESEALQDLEHLLAETDTDEACSLGFDALRVQYWQPLQLSLMRALSLDSFTAFPTPRFSIGCGYHAAKFLCRGLKEARISMPVHALQDVEVHYAIGNWEFPTLTQLSITWKATYFLFGLGQFATNNISHSPGRANTAEPTFYLFLQPVCKIAEVPNQTRRMQVLAQHHFRHHRRDQQKDTVWERDRQLNCEPVGAEFGIEIN